MFFALSKTLDLALSPWVWAICLAGLAFWLRARRPRAARLVLGAAFLLAYVPSTGWAANRLWRAAERFEAPRVRADQHYDAVVLLGGFAKQAPGGVIEYTTAVDRMLRAHELLREGRADRVLVTAGGDQARGRVEADDIADGLVALGIARERISLGRGSRNTYQNALEARDFVARRGISSLVLVTSAYHMQRAYECFRAVGLAPHVLATDYEAPAFSGWFDAVAPRAKHLAASEWVLRELAGRLVYRVRGYAQPN